MCSRPIVVIALVAALNLSGCQSVETRGHVVGIESVRTRPSLEIEYAALLKELRDYNADGMDSWTMNSEHLFAGSGDLRDRAIAFVREPGALDTLFGHLLDERTAASDVLGTAELLVYFGQYHLTSDEGLWSMRDVDVLRAVEMGRLLDVEKRYPGVPVRDHIIWSASLSERHRASASLRKPTTKPSR